MTVALRALHFAFLPLQNARPRVKVKDQLLRRQEYQDWQARRPHFLGVLVVDRSQVSRPTRPTFLTEGYTAMARNGDFRPSLARHQSAVTVAHQQVFTDCKRMFDVRLNDTARYTDISRRSLRCNDFAIPRAAGYNTAMQFTCPHCQAASEFADRRPAFCPFCGKPLRFRQEGRLASLIAHPRCVFVLAADEEAGRPYMVKELTGSRLQSSVCRPRVFLQAPRWCW
jgi:hypothetical protein